VPDSEQHEMVIEEEQRSGADLWVCPRCGRRVVMRPPPDYAKVVLVPGDEYAIHVGGKGGVRVGRLEVIRAEESPAMKAPDIDWRRWLEDHDIAWDGPAA
jgi:DNA-directed RNA polymerase subunit RPC12/RpoP